MGEAGPESEECPFCGTTIRPSAIVCSACGAFKDKRMGCTGCLALFGAAASSLGALVMAGVYPESAQDGKLGIAIIGLIYAGFAALCYWALARKRRLRWYRRM